MDLYHDSLQTPAIGGNYCLLDFASIALVNYVKSTVIWLNLDSCLF